MILKSNINDIDNIKYLVFDIDGTLTRWTSVPMLIEKALSWFGIPYKDEYKDLLLRAISHNEAYTLLHGRASYETYGYCCETNMPVLRENSVPGITFVNKMMELEKEFVYSNPDTKQTLEELSKYYHLLCLTNWFMKPAVDKLNKFNFNNDIENIYCFETNFLKPTKLSLMRILFDYKINSNELIMIGDSNQDILATIGVGINSVLVDYDNVNQGIHKMADVVITEFSDLKEIFIGYQKTKK